jgi:hypothetical protein
MAEGMVTLFLLLRLVLLFYSKFPSHGECTWGIHTKANIFILPEMFLSSLIALIIVALCLSSQPEVMPMQLTNIHRHMPQL